MSNAAFTPIYPIESRPITDCRFVTVRLADGRTPTAYLVNDNVAEAAYGFAGNTPSIPGTVRCHIKRLCADAAEAASTDITSITDEKLRDKAEYTTRRLCGWYMRDEGYALGTGDGANLAIELLADGRYAVGYLGEREYYDDDYTRHIWYTLYIHWIVDDDPWGRVGGLYNKLDKAWWACHARLGGGEPQYRDGFGLPDDK